MTTVLVPGCMERKQGGRQTDFTSSTYKYLHGSKSIPLENGGRLLWYIPFNYAVWGNQIPDYWGILSGYNIDMWISMTCKHTAAYIYFQLEARCSEHLEWENHSAWVLSWWREFSGQPLTEFWWHILSGCQVCDWGIQYHLCSTYRRLWGLVVAQLP